MGSCNLQNLTYQLILAIELNNMPDKEVRIQKYIANHSPVSRRKAEELIKKGAVLVNGVTASIGQKIFPEKTKITVNGNNIEESGDEITIAFHKAKGSIVSKKDPQKRITIYDSLPQRYMHLVHVGRLDKESEGIILLTSNGELCYRLTHPKYEIEKEYLVQISGIPKNSALSKIKNGISIDGVHIKPLLIKIDELIEGNNSVLRIILTEGKKREIRRLITHMGFKVIKLQRVRIGNITLKDIGSDKIRELGPRKINGLKKMVDL